MSPEQTSFWDQSIRALTQTEAWKADMAKRHWANEYKASAETRKYMETEYSELKIFLTELALAN